MMGIAVEMKGIGESRCFYVTCATDVEREKFLSSLGDAGYEWRTVTNEPVSTANEPSFPWPKGTYRIFPECMVADSTLPKQPGADCLNARLIVSGEGTGLPSIFFPESRRKGSLLTDRVASLEPKFDFRN